MNKIKLFLSLFIALLVSLTGSAQTIAGTTSICLGYTTTLMGSPSGGTWSSSAPAIATVGSITGVVTGLTPGSVLITYTLPSMAFASTTVFVLTAPAAITGITTVCLGSTTTLADAVLGGTWTSAAPGVATVGAATGIVTGVSPGTASISYTTASGCFTSTTVTVSPIPTITMGGPSSICVAATTTATGSPAGGAWSATGGITVSGTGVITGTSAGAGTFSYVTTAGCPAFATVTVLATPAPIGGSASVCAGATTTLTDASAGGTWASSATSVGTIDPTTGVAAGLAPGTSTISYSLSTGCMATIILTVNTIPSVSTSASAASCGNSYSLTASGATTYVWSPATGLSCVSCSSPVATPSATTAYSVTGTTAGCSGTAMATISVDRVYGHITFSSTAPSTPSLKVWLIKYNPSDSSITGVDSATSCNDGGTEYYQFDSKPAGNYLVKAKLISAVAGTSDYIPTYGSSTPNWYTAASIAHTAGGLDVQDINMLYGTVPSGPGFISGYVYSGAGKGTAGDVPVAGMLIYLKNTAGQVLTYTYTNASGTFTFGSLAYGSYIIYPEEQSYYTTPSDVIILSASAPGYNAANFRQYLTSGVIKPAVTTNVFSFTTAVIETGIYPNPAKGFVNIAADQSVAGMATVRLTDMTGRSVYATDVEIGGKDKARIDLSGIAAGIYIMKISSEHVNYTTKLLIQE